MRSSGDPVPSISQAAATGEIADLYADIRQTLGMTFVNLIWHNLAPIPDALRWTWETMKPRYANGAVYREADALRQGQELPPVPQLSVAALRSVGLGADNQNGIRTTLSGHDTGNPLNLVGFCAVRARLHGLTPPACPWIQQPPHRPPPAACALLMNLDEMPPHVAEMVRIVNLIGARSRARDLQVSLPRNLAHWPGMLVLYYTDPATAARQRLAAGRDRCGDRRRQTSRACSQRRAGEHRPAGRRNRHAHQGFTGKPGAERDGTDDPDGEPVTSLAAS
ncbi:hypothetical protein [Mycobacterium gastri]|uniref:hypothetical protein n=1 Tax=Mycobacterium gastri TaxID=1777 RepID=UPI0003E4AB2B|nr:hypothetical protein [Mycobacterium gastri]ETW25911.1 hypothetical protein MGAST_30395 [Mycobacterium gastri 'Wayne']